MEIDYSILYITLVFLAILGLFYIGFNISSSIEIQGNYIIFWIMYLITVVSFFTMGFSIYFYYSIEKKKGPPGKQGLTGPKGEDGDKGKCDANCDQGFCYKNIYNAILSKVNHLSRNDQSSSVTNTIKINNMFIKNKIKEMCESDEYEALKEYKPSKDIIDKLVELWAGKKNSDGEWSDDENDKGWVDHLYEQGTHIYFENMGAHHEFDWNDDKNPWDEIMLSDYYYMGLNDPDDPDNQFSIIPQKDAQSCINNPDSGEECNIEAFSNYNRNSNYSNYIEGFSTSTTPTIQYGIKIPYQDPTEQEKVYVCPKAFLDSTHNPYTFPSENSPLDNSNYYNKKRENLKYNIYPHFLLLTDTGSINSNNPPKTLNYELAEKYPGRKYTAYNLYKISDPIYNTYLYKDNNSDNISFIPNQPNYSLCKFEMNYTNTNPNPNSDLNICLKYNLNRLSVEELPNSFNLKIKNLRNKYFSRNSSTNAFILTDDPGYNLTFTKEANYKNKYRITLKGTDIYLTRGIGRESTRLKWNSNPNPLPRLVLFNLEKIKNNYVISVDYYSGEKLYLEAIENEENRTIFKIITRNTIFHHLTFLFENKYLNISQSPAGSNLVYSLNTNKYNFKVNKKKLINKKINVTLFSEKWNNGLDTIIRDANQEPVPMINLLQGNLVKSIKINSVNNKVKLFYKDDITGRFVPATYFYNTDKNIEYVSRNVPINIEYESVFQNIGKDIKPENYALIIEKNN